MKSNIVFKKTKWTSEEDQLLKESIEKNGTSNWSVIASALSCRSGKQCRERWLNQLNPNLNKTDWTPSDDALLFAKHTVYGNLWVSIAKFFPGRSSNAIKNRWSWLTRHHYNPFIFLGNPIDQNRFLNLMNESNIQIQSNPQNNSESDNNLISIDTNLQSSPTDLNLKNISSLENKSTSSSPETTTFDLDLIEIQNPVTSMNIVPEDGILFDYISNKMIDNYHGLFQFDKVQDSLLFEDVNF